MVDTPELAPQQDNSERHSTFSPGVLQGYGTAGGHMVTGLVTWPLKVSFPSLPHLPTPCLFFLRSPPKNLWHEIFRHPQPGEGPWKEVCGARTRSLYSNDNQSKTGVAAGPPRPRKEVMETSHGSSNQFNQNASQVVPHPLHTPRLGVQEQGSSAAQNPGTTRGLGSRAEPFPPSGTDHGKGHATRPGAGGG